MGLRKQEDHVEHVYHIWWCFIIKVYHFSAGVEDKTKDVLLRVKVDATPPSPVGSVSVGISPVVTPRENRVAMLDTEHIDLIAMERTKLNPWKLVKKRESQIGELDQLTLKIDVLYGDRDCEIHMT